MDSRTKIKQHLLRYFNINQDKLYTNIYQGLVDIFKGMQNQEVDMQNLM